MNTAFSASYLWNSGVLHGESVQSSRKTLGDMRGLFHDRNSCELSDDTVLYTVQWLSPGGRAEGSLLVGCTHLQPGRVGDEYFMTHGHFHALSSRAEIYFPVSGTGLLLRMERGGRTWAEEMTAGKVLYIDGCHAHRVINTGCEPMVFWACWPGDAGYDYDSIVQAGFGLRVIERDGKPMLVDRE